MPICIDCRKRFLYLKYGRCEKCFKAWPEHDNPEPDARSNPLRNRVVNKGKRGMFIVSLPDGGFFTTKKPVSVPQNEAFVFLWKMSADDVAEEKGGSVVELSPKEKK